MGEDVRQATQEEVIQLNINVNTILYKMGIEKLTTYDNIYINVMKAQSPRG